MEELELMREAEEIALAEAEAAVAEATAGVNIDALFDVDEDNEGSDSDDKEDDIKSSCSNKQDSEGRSSTDSDQSLQAPHNGFIRKDSTNINENTEVIIDAPLKSNMYDNGNYKGNQFLSSGSLNNKVPSSTEI